MEDIFPIKNGDIPASYVIVYQRVHATKNRTEHFRACFRQWHDLRAASPMDSDNDFGICFCAKFVEQ